MSKSNTVINPPIDSDRDQYSWSTLFSRGPVFFVWKRIHACWVLVLVNSAKQGKPFLCNLGAAGGGFSLKYRFTLCAFHEGEQTNGYARTTVAISACLFSEWCRRCRCPRNALRYELRDLDADKCPCSQTFLCNASIKSSEMSS